MQCKGNCSIAQNYTQMMIDLIVKDKYIQRMGNASSTLIVVKSISHKPSIQQSQGSRKRQCTLDISYLFQRRGKAECAQSIKPQIKRLRDSRVQLDPTKTHIQTHTLNVQKFWTQTRTRTYQVWQAQGPKMSLIELNFIFKMS